MWTLSVEKKGKKKRKKEKLIQKEVIGFYGSNHMKPKKF